MDDLDIAALRTLTRGLHPHGTITLRGVTMKVLIAAAEERDQLRVRLGSLLAAVKDLGHEDVGHHICGTFARGPCDCSMKPVLEAIAAAKETDHG